jgi:RNA polymerase sigma factor (sigma-70 family)
MANPKPTLLSELHSLFGAESAARLLDRQLLDGFKTAHEQVAFAALVRRHGPMVLNVCRRVLHNDSDAEDAFQATFLVLARKAGGIGKREALAAWLHKVAYRVALRAWAEKAARQGHELQATARLGEDPLAGITGRELLTVLDEELQGLPERLRAPLILCYLEEQTQHKAAMLLSLSERTLRRRLQHGREALRRRLERRGLALPAAFLAAATLQRTAEAALPGLLVAGTIKAAIRTAAGDGIAGIVSVQTAKLVTGTLHAMAVGKAKTAAAAVMTLALLGAGLGVAGYRTVPLGVEPQSAPPASQKQAPIPANLKPAKADDQETMVFGGEVLDEQGKPLAGAEVSIWGVQAREGRASLPPITGADEKALAQGQSDAGGRFRFPLPRKALAKYVKFYALAGKIGHGLGLEYIAGVGETALRLPPEKTISGRLFDLQGQPAEGVAVRVSQLGRGAAKSFERLTFSTKPKENQPLWPGPAISDKDGKFVIKGLSPHLWATLEINDDRFTPQRLDIKEGSPDKVQEVSVALPPAQIIEGVVTAADTGKPLANVWLQLFVDHQRVLFGKTDDKGRYRLNPPVTGKEITVTADPADVPYPQFSKTIQWPQGAVHQSLDLAMPRGVLLRGTVTEQGTGKPVAGAVVHDYAHRFIRSATTGPDGIFQIAVPVGKAHLLIKHKDNDFIPMQITEGEIEGRKPAGSQMYPDAVISVDAKAGAEAQPVEAELRRGMSIKGEVLAPDGKAVADGIMLCWSQLPRGVPRWFAAGVKFRDGRFEMRGCDPDEKYPAYFLDPVNKLGATVQLSEKEARGKPVTIRLEPCGDAVARFVNKKGEPLVKSQVILYFVLRPKDKNVRADEDFVGNLDRLNYPEFLQTDAEGRCSFPALIPGATYTILNNEQNRDFTVEPGKTLQLGDVVIAGSE